MKLVGFDADQQKQLSTYQMQKSPIKIKDCQIQRLSYTDDLETKLTPKSSMEKSPTKALSMLCVGKCCVGKTMKASILTLKGMKQASFE